MNAFKQQSPGGPRRPQLAVHKFASCDGCQLTLLSCEDELLTLANRVDISYFLEASSEIREGPYDISLVEGSVSTAHDAERIQQIRQNSKILVTIGACATSGGIQAIRNFASHEEYLNLVYAHPDYIDSLETSTPIADHVKVDFELRGCPIDKRQLLEVLTSLINGRKPRTPQHSVCLECKRSGVVCVEVTQGIPCLGPVTQAGCGALCPSWNRGCFGCFGPCHQANCDSLTTTLQRNGTEDSTLLPLYRHINAAAPEFSEAARRVDKP